MIVKQWKCDLVGCEQISLPLKIVESLTNGPYFESPAGWVALYIKQPEMRCETCGHTHSIFRTHIPNPDIREGDYGDFHFCCEEHRSAWYEARKVTQKAILP